MFFKLCRCHGVGSDRQNTGVRECGVAGHGPRRRHAGPVTHPDIGGRQPRQRRRRCHPRPVPAQIGRRVRRARPQTRRPHRPGRQLRSVQGRQKRSVPRDCPRVRDIEPAHIKGLSGRGFPRSSPLTTVGAPCSPSSCHCNTADIIGAVIKLLSCNTGRCYAFGPGNAGN
jgi:hypothetical protein